MTAHAPGRAVRVGVLLGEQLVEERVFRHGVPVTFGQSLRCALSVPGDGIPAEHVLFTVDQGPTRGALGVRSRRSSGRGPAEIVPPRGLLLRVTAGMQGRIAHGEAIRTELQSGPGEHGVWTIPIERGARGRLQIGDATVLFQEIAAPPIAPRPVLPAAMRGTLADRVDRRLAAIVGLSLVTHLGIAVYAWATEADEGSMLSPSIAQTYRHDTIEVVLPDEAPLPTTTAPEPGPGAATPVSPVQTGKPIIDRPRVTTGRPTHAAPTLSDADIARFASLLSGDEPSATGTGGTMRDRKPGADLQAQISDVGNREIRIGDDGKTFREQPGPRIGTDVGPLVDDPTQLTRNEPKQTEREPGRIQIRPVPGQPRTGTTLTVEMVLEKINTVYMTGLVRCYRKGLVGDTQLSGKVSVAFTVTERGLLEDTSARGVTTEVDACIGAQMNGWRFPIPKDKDGDPDTASFQVVLALSPT